MPNTSVLCLLGITALAANSGWADDYRISGPYTHDNLSIYLIHGGRGGGRKFLTLQQAMDQKKVTVYETGKVNELAIENLSSEDIYIQSGDIVKGGRQDRVFPDDYILPTRSGKVPISSFCVESGRWTRRGKEAADHFSGSTDTVALKDLKVAVRKAENQSEVWNQVANARMKMARAAGVASESMLSAASPTSMQLALQNKNVQDAAGAYLSSLAKIIDGKPDVVGYAFAVNGRVSSADIYRSSDLFQGMWPKLLKAGALEALSSRSSAKAPPPPGVAAVQAALNDAESGNETARKDVARRLQVVTKENSKAMVFETRDRESSGAWVHKNIIVK